MNYLSTYLKGLAMGAADVVPGVSAAPSPLLLAFTILCLKAFAASILAYSRYGKRKAWQEYFVTSTAFF